MNLVPLANTTFALLSIFCQIMAAILLACLFLFKPQLKAVLKFFSDNVLIFSFLVALVSTLGSLFYSEVAGYEPCKLCWYQRILMYPMALLFGLAAYKKDRKVLNYTMAFSGAGAVLALYHYLMQLGIVKEGDCAAVGYSVSCAKTFVMEFGYITIPLMAFSGFLFIFIMGLVAKRSAKKQL